MSSTKTTRLPSSELIGGNSLFRGAAVALGLQGESARLLLHKALKASGFSPDTLTPEEITQVIPEVEVLVRKLLPPALAQVRMQNLHRFLMQIHPD